MAASFSSAKLRADITRARKSSWDEFWFVFKSWQEVVKKFARRHPDRLDFDQETYELLHHDLVEQCRKLAYGDAKKPIRELEELVAPWVSLHSLEELEGENRWKLLESCRALERTLRGRPRRRTVLYALSFLALAGATYWIIVTLPSNVDLSRGRLQYSVNSVFRAIEATSVVQRFQIAAIIAAIMAIVMIRFQKRY